LIDAAIAELNIGKDGEKINGEQFVKSFFAQNRLLQRAEICFSVESDMNNNYFSLLAINTDHLKRLLKAVLQTQPTKILL